ncbi:MAG: hypothetical protein ACREUU_05005 [Gammaproteobacteria bacterium]
MGSANGTNESGANNPPERMAFITRFFIKPAKPALVQLPAGTFTINRKGQILTSTLPQSFPTEDALAIGAQVLAAFRAAQRAQLALAELVIQYSTLTLSAREQRGGAIVFLQPQP